MTNQDNKHEMHFEIMDEASHLRFDVMMTMENFAIAITGQGYMPCKLDMPEDFSILGKTMENKQVSIPFENDPPIASKEVFSEWFEKLVIPYELDGWVADRETSMNFHKLNHIKTSYNMKTYTVTFRRWV
jgi:hypothetical protein